MSDVTPRPGSIGPYPIEREVGRGGMGIVYLGRDARLDRPVAIKVLPDAFAADPERLARFEREARLLASLTHPNIAAIYGLEEAAGRRFLVLEYVEGETLAQRLARGPLPVDEAVDVCRQIAAALEAAHEGGVIHRDLKPGNVKLMPTGEVKVLDFGLAKGGTSSGAGSDSSLSASPTMTAAAATGAGVILGTAAYMSPEQARGRALDRRTDIWSFGCVLYECLAGRQAFAGETVSDMIALILQGEPDWKALPASTPPRLRELLTRCLTKDAKKRLRDIGEAKLLLEGGDSSSASGVYAATPAAAPARGARLGWIVAAAFALVAAALGATLALRAPEPVPVLRVKLEMPPQPPPPRDVALMSLSPDGERVASSAVDSTGAITVWVRALASLEGRTVSGSEDGAMPAFSPDGRFLVFSTQDKLKKVELKGGAPEVLCPLASYGRGQSWGSRGIIVFSGGAEGPIFQVPADGGERAPATTLEPGETGHRYPRFLPDGRHFLYASMPPRGQVHDIWIGSTDDPKRREKLMEADGTPIYVEPGLLLFSRNLRVMAQRFDANSRKLAGKPATLPDEPKRSTYVGSPALAAGLRGPIGYFRPEAVATQLEWYDMATGQRTPLPIAPGGYSAISMTRDEKQAVLARNASQTEADLWLVDLDRLVPTRITFGPGRVDRPVFSPDDRKIAYSTDKDGRWDVFVKDAGAAGPGEGVLVGGSLLKYVSAWTPDGRSLIVEQIGEKTGWDIYELPLDGDRKLRPLFTTPFDEQYGAVSPDGRWIAYSSNASGRTEVYVDSYPEPGRHTQISTAGGFLPIWRRDGRELFYLVGTDALAVTSVDPATGRATGPARILSRRFGSVSGAFGRDFRRALGLFEVAGTKVSDDLTIVDGWREELEKR